MHRRLRRRGMAALTAAVFATGMLGFTVASPAGAATRSQVTPPPPGAGVTITVLDETVQPVGPLSFT